MQGVVGEASGFKLRGVPARRTWSGDEAETRPDKKVGHLPVQSLCVLVEEQKIVTKVLKMQAEEAG